MTGFDFFCHLFGDRIRFDRFCYETVNFRFVGPPVFRHIIPHYAEVFSS